MSYFVDLVAKRCSRGNNEKDELKLNIKINKFQVKVHVKVSICLLACFKNSSKTNKNPELRVK